MSEFQPLERPLFFAGKLLTVADFQQDQDYLLGRLRRLNRTLRGWGVVAGLDVSVDGTTVTVAPGLAIDCAGNEIVLAASRAVPIEGTASRGYVVIRFVETPVGAVPTPDGDPRFSRAREDAMVELLSTNPNRRHRGRGPGTPGCGDPHGVCIATLAKRGRGWRALRQGGVRL